MLCCRLVTLGRHQQLAGDGAPADGVQLPGHQAAPEVTAAVVLEAFVPQQGFVPWRDTHTQI